MRVFDNRVEYLLESSHLDFLFLTFCTLVSFEDRFLFDER